MLRDISKACGTHEAAPGAAEGSGGGSRRVSASAIGGTDPSDPPGRMDGMTIHTVGELIARLQQLPHDMPLLVDGYESGFTRATLELHEVQELRGLGWYRGEFVTPREASRQVEGGDWTLMQDGTPPTPVGEPFTAAVLRRVEQRDDD